MGDWFLLLSAWKVNREERACVEWDTKGWVLSAPWWSSLLCLPPVLLGLTPKAFQATATWLKVHLTWSLTTCAHTLEPFQDAVSPSELRARACTLKLWDVHEDLGGLRRGEAAWKPGDLKGPGISRRLEAALLRAVCFASTLAAAVWRLSKYRSQGQALVTDRRRKNGYMFPHVRKYV